MSGNESSLCKSPSLYRPKTSNKHKMFYVESTCVFPETPLSFKLSLTKLVFHSA